MGEARLLLVRHGHTSFNDHGEERLRGWLDIPLDKEGISDAHRAANQLAGVDAHEVVAADLQRSSHTAQIIADKLKIPVRLDPRLRAWNMGMFAGKDLKDVEDKLLHHLTHPDQPIPGGESFGDFLDRWRAALHRMIGVSNEVGKDVIGVTSHSNLLSVDSALSGTKPTNVSKGAPYPGDVIPVEVEV